MLHKTQTSLPCNTPRFTSCSQIYLSTASLWNCPEKTAGCCCWGSGLEGHLCTAEAQMDMLRHRAATSLQGEFTKVSWNLCVHISVFRKMLELKVLQKQMYFRALTTNIECRLHKGLWLHPQNHPALGSLYLNLEGGFHCCRKTGVLLEIYRRQIVQLIFHPCLHSSPAQATTLFESLSHFLHCHKCLASRRAPWWWCTLWACGLHLPQGPSHKFCNTFVHCTCNTIGF